MKKAIKISVVFVLSLMIVFSFACCKKKENDNTDNSSKADTVYYEKTDGYDDGSSSAVEGDINSGSGTDSINGNGNQSNDQSTEGNSGSGNNNTEKEFDYDDHSNWTEMFTDD